MYMSVLSAFMYIPYACLVLRSSEEGFGSPETGIKQKVVNCHVNALLEQQGYANHILSPW